MKSFWLILTIWVMHSSSSASPNTCGRNHVVPAPRYVFKVYDHPGEKRFLLSLKSLDDRALCIYVEEWPNGKGQLHFGSTWVTLETQARVYPARDENFGYCVSERGKPCVIRIAPRSELRGFIGYAEFGDSAKIASLHQRKLRFKVSPQICKE
jgi:hypothetical protein